MGNCLTTTIEPKTNTLIYKKNLSKGTYLLSFNLYTAFISSSNGGGFICVNKTVNKTDHAIWRFQANLTNDIYVSGMTFVNIEEEYAELGIYVYQTRSSAITRTSQYDCIQLLKLA